MGVDIWEELKAGHIVKCATLNFLLDEIEKLPYLLVGLPLTKIRHQHPLFTLMNTVPDSLVYAPT